MHQIANTPTVGAPQDPFAEYIDRAEYARRAGITHRTAELQAHKGTGPRVTRIGRRAMYHLDDVQAWLNEQRAKASKRFERKGGAA